MKNHRKSQHEVRIKAHQRSCGSRKRVGDEKISKNCRGFPSEQFIKLQREINQNGGYKNICHGHNNNTNQQC